MSVSTRVVVGGVLAAAAIAVPAAAMAFSSPSEKPAASKSAVAASKTAAEPALDRSAAVALKSAAAAAEPRGDRSITGPAAVAALAGRLGVSETAAERALRQISALSGTDGVDPDDPAFAGIAHGLGVSPARLAAAMDAVKRAVAGG